MGWAVPAPQRALPQQLRGAPASASAHGEWGPCWSCPARAAPGLLQPDPAPWQAPRGQSPAPPGLRHGSGPCLWSQHPHPTPLSRSRGWRCPPGMQSLVSPNVGAIRPWGPRCPGWVAPWSGVRWVGAAGGLPCREAGGAPWGVGTRCGPAPRCSLIRLPSQHGADFLQRHVRGVEPWQPGEPGTAPRSTASWAAPCQQVGWSGHSSGGPAPGDCPGGSTRMGPYCSWAVLVLREPGELPRRSRGWWDTGQLQASLPPCCWEQWSLESGSLHPQGQAPSSLAPWPSWLWPSLHVGKPTGIFGACEAAMVRAVLVPAGTRCHQGCQPAMGTGRPATGTGCPTTGTGWSLGTCLWPRTLYPALPGGPGPLGPWGLVAEGCCCPVGSVGTASCPCCGAGAPGEACSRLLCCMQRKCRPQRGWVRGWVQGWVRGWREGRLPLTQQTGPWARGAEPPWGWPGPAEHHCRPWQTWEMVLVGTMGPGALRGDVSHPTCVWAPPPSPS